MTEPSPTFPPTTQLPAVDRIRASLLLAALGIVFGDIGTSPLYALRECFVGSHAMPLTPDNILGAVSLVFWFLVLVVCIKYVILIMRADNKGEGGIMALTAMVEHIGPKNKYFTVIIPLLGIVGASLLFGDGVITPAITVLSAVEGLTVGTPSLTPFVIPLTLIILVGLFLIQSRGSAKIGAMFGPVLCVWFVTIGVLGAASIFHHPGIFMAVNPWYAIQMLIANGQHALGIIGTAFLCVTGAEVLYADMGHFGKKSIRLTWFCLVFPALILNYMGQGAYLLQADGIPDNLFFRLAPNWFLLPLVCIATAASIIASQAVITGAFSLARQAVQLGFWPRVRVVHTSPLAIGQVYVPFVNIALCICTIMLILVFRHSTRLAGAYGIAVSATMLITTVLALLIARKVWRAPLLVIVLVGGFFLVFHSGLFAANLVKLMSGGWVVVVIGTAVSIMMATWLTGRLILRRRVEQESVPLAKFADEVATLKPLRVKGTAVFLSANVGAVPRALLHNYKHNKVLHERTIIAAVLTAEVPAVHGTDKAQVTELGNGLIQIVLRYGFMQTPNIPRDLSNIPGITIDPMQVSYFLGKESLVLAKQHGLSRWQKHLFRYMAHNSLGAVQFYNLPPNRVVELGAQVEL